MKSSDPQILDPLERRTEDDKASPQETHHALVNESILSRIARTAEQVDDIAQRHEMSNDSAPEATIPDSHHTSNRRQQVVMFSEEGVTVHEAPFLKDAVNAQALRVADSGKYLSTRRGGYFLWRDCFDDLVRTETAEVLVTGLTRMR
ncbi:hypothetical protein VC83_09685 [Pseudogymnoascus destructans]|uniref:Uncharacterized protein n=2 Tax=Pseudogymnoascus destructans TaxID=655981 RepID=L8FRQ8_PSED2|nr:uncharacterized protein VC83_09685 [Pseudogymnoascus destructans]ELR03660.1 hypothetical protein GMDG_06303 [Pseudogymnoascus destructans 20631-21]PQM43558.1 hypothetical protein VC83_09685 [Pseudogymnoascus destructans]